MKTDAELLDWHEMVLANLIEASKTQSRVFAAVDQLPPPLQEKARRRVGEIVSAPVAALEMAMRCRAPIDIAARVQAAELGAWRSAEAAIGEFITA